jgi:hypothetical protein
MSAAVTGQQPVEPPPADEDFKEKTKQLDQKTAHVGGWKQSSGSFVIRLRKMRIWPTRKATVFSDGAANVYAQPVRASVSSTDARNSRVPCFGVSDRRR